MPILPPIMGQGSASETSIILEPLATFVGATRMVKRDALNAVLSHINANNLFDAEDELYILLDERLKTLDPRFVNLDRIKLRILAKIVAKCIVGKDQREPAAAEEPLSPKRKIMDEDAVKGPIADEQRACKKGRMVSHAMDEVDDGNTFPQQQQMASAVNNTDIDVDVIGDLEDEDYDDVSRCHT